MSHKELSVDSFLGLGILHILSSDIQYSQEKKRPNMWQCEQQPNCLLSICTAGIKQEREKKESLYPPDNKAGGGCLAGAQEMKGCNLK